MNDKPVYNLLLSFIKSRSKLFLFERYRYKSFKDSINWSYISRFDYYPDDGIICSICFNEPILPRMDKCGHIFCLSCLLNLSKHLNSKIILCPLCKNYKINVFFTKRVTLAENKSINIGDKLTFRLLVKGNNSLFPDFHYKLVAPLPKAPLSTANNSNFSNVSIDSDANIINFIKKDLTIFKEMKQFIRQLNGDDVTNETEQFLNNELIDFKMDISVGDIATEQKTKPEKPIDCFNIKLGINQQLERFTLFYQCTVGRFVFLEPLQSGELIKKLKKKCKVEGEVISIRIEKVTPALMNETKLMHVPMGSVITFVKIDMKKAVLHNIPNNCFRGLVENKKILSADKMNLEKMRMESAAKRLMLAKQGKMFTPMVDESFCNDLSNMNISRMSEDTIPSSFNMCMIGVDCVDPDDDYPHAKNCIYFQRSVMHNSVEYIEESIANIKDCVDELKAPLIINDIKDCVDELKAPIIINNIKDCVDELKTPLIINDECLKYNYPPEDINEMKPFLKPDPFVMKYLVIKNKTTQREDKNLKKKNKK